MERDALVAKTDVLERCLLTGKEEPLPSNEQSPTTSGGGGPTSKVSMGKSLLWWHPRSRLLC